jgi:hypothetical protein
MPKISSRQGKKFRFNKKNEKKSQPYMRREPMSNDDFATKLERSFVELVAERARRRGFRKGAFAHQLWPEASLKAAASRWTAMRGTAAHTGKPQGVSISDAQRMAEVLGEELSYLLAVAKENARK